MKKPILLLLIPATIALSGCTQEVKLGGQDTNLVNKTITQANEVVYPDDNPSVPDGKLIYTKMQCAQCHGADGSTPVKASAETLKVFASNTNAGQQMEGGTEASGVASPAGSQGLAQPIITKTEPDPAANGTISLADKNFMGRTYPLEQYVMLSQGRKGHAALRDQLTRRQIWDLVFYSRSLSTPLLTAEEWAKVDPVFGSNCAVCHGKRGHGDGPLGRNLEPIPANFHQYNRFYQRTDDQIFDHIAYGIKWEGMPNFLGKTDNKKNIKFDKAYIRTLVQYVRNFGESNIATQPETASANTQGNGVGQ